MTELLESSVADQFDRLPPHSLEAERATISSAALDPQMLDAIREIVAREDFFQADHQIIFDALCKLRDMGRACDIITLREHLAAVNLLNEIGGVAYLGECMGSMPSAANGEHYAKIVKEKALLRAAITLSNTILRRAYASQEGDEAGKRILEEASESIIRLLARNQVIGVQPLAHYLTQVIDQIDKGGIPCVRSGFRDLDNLITGFGETEMWVIAAAPSMGKSTLCKQLAVQASKQVPVGYISNEEGGCKIARNILSAESSVANTRIRHGNVSEMEWKEIEGAMSRLVQLPVYVRENATHIDDVATAATVMVRRHGCKLLIIDYLQRIGGGQGKSSYERVSDISNRISDILKRLGVAGIIVSALNRELFHREDRRPRMSDLRESGRIEFDADGILMLHREDFWHIGDDTWTPNNELELIPVKIREGDRSCSIVLKAEMSRQRFTDGYVVGPKQGQEEPESPL
jgi:replicative DNA helicase